MDVSDLEDYGHEFNGDGMDMPIGQPVYNDALNPNVDDDQLFQTNKK